MNSITIAGQLGKDSELRHLPNGDPVCSFSVADQQGKNKPTIWWNCSLFGKRAESLQQYLFKGQKVTICGSVSERDWTDKEGNKRKSIDVRVNEIDLQGNKQSSNEQNFSATTPANKSVDFDQDIPF
jgi:single-strand DNA-binding protein